MDFHTINSTKTAIGLNVKTLFSRIICWQKKERTNLPYRELSDYTSMLKSRAKSEQWPRTMYSTLVFMRYVQYCNCYPCGSLMQQHVLQIFQNVHKFHWLDCLQMTFSKCFQNIFRFVKLFAFYWHLLKKVKHFAQCLFWLFIFLK